MWNRATLVESKKTKQRIKHQHNRLAYNILKLTVKNDFSWNNHIYISIKHVYTCQRKNQAHLLQMRRVGQAVWKLHFPRAFASCSLTTSQSVPWQAGTWRRVSSCCSLRETGRLSATGESQFAGKLRHLAGTRSPEYIWSVIRRTLSQVSALC